MKALTKPEKFQAMSRIYGYEGPWDVAGYHCVEYETYVCYEDGTCGTEVTLECESTCDDVFDCDDC